jgi:hypothetical protein
VRPDPYKTLQRTKISLISKLNRTLTFEETL